MISWPTSSCPSRQRLTRYKRPQALRSALERMAVPAQSDVRSELVTADGVDGEWITAPGANRDRIVLYFHGGGYVVGSVNTHRDLMGRISRAAQARVFGLNYRLAPEHPFPAAVEDAFRAYSYLLQQGFRPATIAVAGDSAGGGLTFSSLVAARDAGIALPAAAVSLSPWVDLEGQGRSMTTFATIDPMASHDGVRILARMYLGGKDPRTPLAAPLYADLTGLPPTLIQVGDAEALLDDAKRIADRATIAGVTVELEVWPGMSHVWQRFANFLPAGQQALERVGEFIRAHTP